MKDLPIRQGDVLLFPVSSMPKDVQLVEGQENKIVLAWGEVTGHHHRIEDHHTADEIASALFARLFKASNGDRYLEVVGSPVTLLHEEHTAHKIPPGIYKLPNQVEYSPAELRRVAD